MNDVRGIRIAAATYRYPASERPALESIDAAVAPGEVVGIVGPNEAGKSTLCLIASAFAPRVVGGHLSGDVTIDGRPTADLRPSDLAQLCGLLRQDPMAQLSGTARTVFEEVAFGPQNLGLPVAEIVERAWAALRLLHIEHLAERDPNALSGGQAQLTILAGVLALRPAYLVLDEPTSELDPAGSKLVSTALRGLAAETGTGILLAEHKTDLLESVCDRVIVLDAGRIALDGPAESVLADPRLDELGVEPPARARLERSLRAAGIETGVISTALSVSEAVLS